MKINEILKNLKLEIDRAHRINVDENKKSEGGIPDFVTACNGVQRYFNAAARRNLKLLASTLYSNDIDLQSSIDEDQLFNIVKQCVADFHAENKLCDSADYNQVKKDLVSTIRHSVHLKSLVFTHYFPAWTLGMERVSRIDTGPMRIITRDEWIDSVDFSDSVKENHRFQPEKNNKWKEELREVLKNPSSDIILGGLSATIFNAIEKWPAIIRVTLSGKEITLSRKLARIIGKSGLDGISLLFENADVFSQQTLNDERLPPFGSSSLVEINNYLCLPGSTLSNRIPIISPKLSAKHLEASRVGLESIGFVLTSLAEPDKAISPGLCQRWATALDWYGEGNREENDAIAVTKIATCLDILSCGGKYGGILDMIGHLLDLDENTIILKKPAEKSLADVVRDIYDNGRSKILHGTHTNRLQSFSTLRKISEQLAGSALLKAVTLLPKYKGEDIDTGFRSMGLAAVDA